MKYEAAKMRACMRFGHDWAFQDCDTFVAKICLRCGAEQYFFPEEIEDENLDVDSTETL